jgi:predicted glycosyltransferase involved in capsule biosynthesis
MISFVFYFSGERLDNLEQTLRFLNKNEDLKNKEVILVCNDRIETEASNEYRGPKYKLFNLKLKSYMKPKMCNFGVDKATHDIVALLDGDRILPNRYFEKNAKKLNKKEFISTLVLHKLLGDYNDKDIELKNYEYVEELKSKTCQHHKKNLFSGNTLFYKKDYLDSGGMDESFVGYGYADNDMTMNIVSKGYTVKWNNDIELHLNHSKSFLYKSHLIEKPADFEKISRSNLEKLKHKWKSHKFF